MDPNGVSYVVLHDTNLDDEATLYATSLQMIDLVQQINREIKAQRVILILDTCFSGDALTALESGAPGSGAGHRLVRQKLLRATVLNRAASAGHFRI